MCKWIDESIPVKLAMHVECETCKKVTTIVRAKTGDYLEDQGCYCDSIEEYLKFYFKKTKK